MVVVLDQQGIWFGDLKNQAEVEAEPAGVILDFQIKVDYPQRRKVHGEIAAV